MLQADGDDLVDSIIDQQRPEIEEYLKEDGSINWEAHMENVWRLSAQAFETIEKEVERRIEFQESLPNLPRTDTGVTVEGLFRRFNKLLPNPDRLTPQTYERMALDPKISACLETITESVVSGWELIGGEEEHRKHLTQMFKKLRINRVLEQVLMRTLQFGHTSTEKVYDMVNGLWEIVRYKVLISKDIQYRITDTGIMKQIWQFVSAANNFSQSAVSDPTISGRINGVRKFTPIKINHMAFKPMFGNPYGTSALKAANKAWILKDHMLRYWARHLEILGGGWIVGKTGGMKTKKFREDLDKAKDSSTIAINSEQEIEILWPPGQKSSFGEMVNYYDSKIAEVLIVPILLLGQNTDFGSQNLGETHFSLFKITRVDPLQDDLKEWVQDDIKILIDRNFGPQEEYPELKFKAWSTLELEQLANFYRKLAAMQAVGTEDIWWIRRDLELPPLGPNGIGEPLVKIQNQPGVGDADSGDTGDTSDSPKRQGTGAVN